MLLRHCSFGKEYFFDINIKNIRNRLKATLFDIS